MKFAYASHCWTDDDPSDFAYPWLDLASGALGSSNVVCVGCAIAVNVAGNGAVDDKVTHFHALVSTEHHSGEWFTSLNTDIPDS